MTQRISGSNFTTNIGDLAVRVNKVTLDITDNSAVAMDGGIPNGYVAGSVEGSGEIEVTASNFNLIVEAANIAGSFRELGTFDLTFFAKTDNDEIKIQAFGCLLTISSLLDIDRAGGENTLMTLPYQVTSPDFVRINGTSYLSNNEIEGIVQ